MNTRGPTFSIVMPAYDAEATIAPAVRSVLAQTRSDYELIVVDDGSRDGTVAAVRAFAEPRIVLLERANGGPAAARNTALDHARGRYVCFLDSDDLYLPTYLERMHDVLARSPGLGFAYPDAWVMAGRGDRIRRTSTLAQYPEPAEDPEDWLELLIDYNVVHYMAMVPRQVLERVGGFDERLRAAMDYELWLRIAAHGYRAVRIPELLGVYRETAGSITTRRLLVNENLAKVYAAVAEEYEVPERAKALARGQLELARLRSEAIGGNRSRAARRERWRRAVRRRLGAPGRRLRERRLWYRTPPDELAAFLSRMGVS